MADYNQEDYLAEEDDEYLVRCVVDTQARCFRVYSSQGDEKVIECDTVDEFMNVLELIRAVVPEETVAYSEMVTAKP